MEDLAPHPQIAEGIGGKKDNMLDDQGLAPRTLGILAIPVVHIGEGAPGTGGHDDHGGDNAAPEEEVFKAVQYADDCRVVEVSTVKHRNRNDGRQPDAGGKIMDKAVEDNQGFLQHTVSRIKGGQIN
jgi:hypothetical protein